MTAPALALDTAAEGLWLRLRDVLLAEQQIERFEFSPEAPGGVTDRLLAVLRDRDVRLALARDLTLRSLTALSDSTNFRILDCLGGGAPVPLVDVARAADLGSVAATERVHALAQVGLAARDVERSCAVETAAGRGLRLLVVALAAAVTERMERALPALLGPDGAHPEPAEA